MRHEPPCTGTKTCSRCHATLHVLAFSISHSTKDGLQPLCRACHSKAAQNSPSNINRRNHTYEKHRIGMFPTKYEP